MTWVKLLILAGASWAIQRRVIQVLTHNKTFQKIYKLSPKSHQKKASTPSFGGVGIALSMILATALFWPLSPAALWVVGVFLSFAGIGFWDDWLSLKGEKNRGLSAKEKFVIQLVISIGLLTIYTQLFGALSVWNWGFYTFLLVGSANATNLTDGLDGLLGGLSIITLLGFTLLIPVSPLWGLCYALIVAIAAFLFFNLHPAKIFMGDTGSLALGAFFAAVTIVLGNPWLLIPLGAVYIIETLSVILQVLYYKLTQKRIFLMAPIHHHFEMMGMSEKAIVYSFWVFALICTLVKTR